MSGRSPTAHVTHPSSSLNMEGCLQSVGKRAGQGWPLQGLTHPSRAGLRSPGWAPPRPSPPAYHCCSTVVSVCLTKPGCLGTVVAVLAQSLPSAWMRESEGLQILGALKRQGRLDVAQGVTRLSSSTSELRAGVIIQVFIQQMSVELLLCTECYSRSLGGMNVLNRRSPCSHGAKILEGGNGE